MKTTARRAATKRHLRPPMCTAPPSVATARRRSRDHKNSTGLRECIREVAALRLSMFRIVLVMLYEMSFLHLFQLGEQKLAAKTQRLMWICYVYEATDGPESEQRTPLYQRILRMALTRVIQRRTGSGVRLPCGENDAEMARHIRTILETFRARYHHTEATPNVHLCAADTLAVQLGVAPAASGVFNLVLRVFPHALFRNVYRTAINVLMPLSSACVHTTRPCRLPAAEYIEREIVGLLQSASTTVTPKTLPVYELDDITKLVPDHSEKILCLYARLKGEHSVEHDQFALLLPGDFGVVIDGIYHVLHAMLWLQDSALYAAPGDYHPKTGCLAARVAGNVLSMLMLLRRLDIADGELTSGAISQVSEDVGSAIVQLLYRIRVDATAVLDMSVGSDDTFDLCSDIEGQLLAPGGPASLLYSLNMASALGLNQPLTASGRDLGLHCWPETRVTLSPLDAMRRSRTLPPLSELSLFTRRILHHMLNSAQAQACVTVVHTLYGDTTVTCLRSKIIALCDSIPLA